MLGGLALGGAVVALGARADPELEDRQQLAERVLPVGPHGPQPRVELGPEAVRDYLAVDADARVDLEGAEARLACLGFGFGFEPEPEFGFGLGFGLGFSRRRGGRRSPS